MQQTKTQQAKAEKMLILLKKNAKITELIINGSNAVIILLDNKKSLLSADLTQNPSHI